MQTLGLLIVAAVLVLAVLWLVSPQDGRCLVRQGETVKEHQWIVGLKC